MVVEDKDLAQINATILIGLLFFLAASNYLPSTANIPHPHVITVTTTLMIFIPFTISLIVALAGRTKLSKVLTAISLGWLVVILIFLLKVAYDIDGVKLWG